MKLKIGKMTNQDLADWCEIAPKTLRNTKPKRLEELKEYADFYEEKGKVYITHIYEDTYSRKKVYPRVKELMPVLWNKDGLDTSTRVGNEIYGVVSQEGYPQTHNTVVNYTRKAKRENYGVAFDEEGGLLGKCIFEYAKKGPDGELVELTPREKETYRKITKEYYGEDMQERLLFMIESLVDNDEQLEYMDQEELKGLVRSISKIITGGKNFWDWKDKVEEALGFSIVKATRLKPNEVGYNWEEDTTLQ